MSEIVAIGEGMLELTREHSGKDAWRLRHGGDTLNVAVYFARLRQNVAFVTALGEDSFSNGMRRDWADEGIDVSLALTMPTRLPGLYLVETDAEGERNFLYWREQSAARALFACEGIESAIDRATSAKLLYLSGIALSLFDETGRQRLVALSRQVRENGGAVAFDPNYRRRGWTSAEAARAAIADLVPYISIAMPTFDDEVLLYGHTSPEQCRAHWAGAGVSELVIKLGSRGALVANGENLVSVPTIKNSVPLDTTGAGDAFNAAYLAARRRGLNIVGAAEAGNILAAAVIQHPGAIISMANMP